MGSQRTKLDTGRGQGAWPVLLLLLMAVVVPTACVLWFMAEAMRNERLAVRQKLTEVYRGQLATVRDRLDTYWRDRAGSLARVEVEPAAAEVFARLVRTGECDSAILYNHSGQLLYPVVAPVAVPGPETESPEWIAAREAEYQRPDPAAAAEQYGQIAQQASEVNVAARALQAQARCLAKAGRTEAAIDLITGLLADDKYRDARDGQGRFIVPNARLLALQLMDHPQRPEYDGTLQRLVQRLDDYREPVLPSSQRRFLMHQLQTIAADCPPLPTLSAEDLAGDYLEAYPPAPQVAPLGPVLLRDAWQPTSPHDQAPRLRPTRLRNVWKLASADNSVVALFRQDRIVSHAQHLAESHVSFTDVDIELLPPTAKGPGKAPLVTADDGEFLPDWQLALYLRGTDPLARAAGRQIAVYLWTAVLVIAVIAALALLVARHVGRQMKLTRLKNDLIATVSHELKTPLSSMRVLVDTLLEGRYRGQEQVHEYLGLIARENTRLSRLIDNFLTFSRMERNKRAFEFAHVRVEDVVSAATEAVRERFTSSGFSLDIQVPGGLPAITGDRDALITVILNLLDNAYKYSEDDKHVVLRAYESDANVCLQVADRGVGVSRRAAKKVFDRFYQVDRSLTRRAGGCGLGLSIVRFIVEAHGGSIDLATQLGKGSTFTVKLPASRNDER